jgi:mono/diheme cytochrome c family protein
MKKLTQFVGVFATGLISAATLAGCASTPDASTPMTTAGAGGTGGAGGAGGTGGATGTQLIGMAAYTIFTGADAAANPNPAPAAWASSTCSTCHGPNGEGTIIAPEVRHTPIDYAKWVVRFGRPSPSAMIAFPVTSADPLKMPAISDADLGLVLTWLAGMPRPTTGEGLYKDFCGNCHGPKFATGGAVPVNVIGKMATEYIQKVRMGEGLDPAMRNGYMPKEDVAALTDAELALIQTYLMAKP